MNETKPWDIKSRDVVRYTNKRAIKLVLESKIPTRNGRRTKEGNWPCAFDFFFSKLDQERGGFWECFLENQMET